MSLADDRLSARRLCPLDIDAGSRTHVRPILADVFDAGLAAVLLVGDGPAGRNFGGCGPERMLTLVIDEDDEAAPLIVERVAHVSCSHLHSRDAISPALTINLHRPPPPP